MGIRLAAVECGVDQRLHGSELSVSLKLSRRWKVSEVESSWEDLGNGTSVRRAELSSRRLVETIVEGTAACKPPQKVDDNRTARKLDNQV